MIMAAEAGHDATVGLPLERGADVNAASFDGWTALIQAAHAGQEPVVRRLIAAGADLAVRE